MARAAEHLVHPGMQTRLSAIYALERIAEIAPEDFWLVVEILTAHVRVVSGEIRESQELQETANANAEDSDEADLQWRQTIHWSSTWSKPVECRRR